MSSCACGDCRRGRRGSGQAPQARMGCWQWQHDPSASWACGLTLGVPQPRVHSGKGCGSGPVPVLVSPVLPGQTPGLGPPAQQGLP